MFTYYIMLSRSYRRKIFEVDSVNRQSGFTHDFSVTLDMPFKNSYNSMTLLYAEIDKTYYMLSTDILDTTVNSFIAITNGVSNSVTITPNVNYNATQLATELQTDLNSGATGYTVVYNADINNPNANSNLYSSGKYKITNSQPFSINLTNVPLIAKYLGLNAALNTATNIAGTYTLVSVKQARLERYDCLVIRTNLSINGTDSVLGYIFPVTTINGGVIVYQNNYSNFLGSVAAGDTQSNYLRCSLTDQATGLSINLGGGAWRFTVCLSEEGI